MLQVAKDATQVQQSVNFGIERPLALVHQMMNREAGDDGIELAQDVEMFEEGFVQIVSHDSNGRLPGKALAGGLQHGGRKINSHGFSSDLLATNKIQQASVAGAQVKDSTSRRRNELEQRRLAFLAMANRVGTFEIVAGVVVRGPEIDGLGGHVKKDATPHYR